MSDTARRVLVLDDDPGILSLLAARLGKLPIHLVQCTEIEAAETLMDHMGFGVLVCDLEVSQLGGLEGIRLIRHAVTNFAPDRSDHLQWQRHATCLPDGDRNGGS